MTGKGILGSPSELSCRYRDHAIGARPYSLNTWASLSHLFLLTCQAQTMIRSILLAGISFPLGAVLALAQFSDTVGRVPRDANTAIFINAERIFASPVATSGRWQQRRESAFAAGISALPPTASEVVLAARTDIEFGQTVWEVSLLRVPGGIRVSDVAARFGGTIETVERKMAARLPGDSFVVQITDNVIAAHVPANRQDVSRWIRATDLVDPSEQRSSYLRQAHQFATRVGTPLIMALDLQDAFSKSRIQEALTGLKSFSESGLDPVPAMELLEGIRGITLGVTFTDSVNAAIRVDFSTSPELLADVGKPMLIEIMENQGAMLEDAQDWTPSIRENTFLLSGRLSETGLRRLLSVLELPAPLAAAMDEVRLADDGTPESAMRVASQQYFQTLSALLDDLRDKPRRNRVQTFGQAAIWYARYARKIDALPILNVDPVLVQFGAETAQQLRNAELAMRGVGMRTAARTVGSNAGFDNTFGGYRSFYNWNGSVAGNVGTPGSNFNVARGAVRAEQQADNIIRTQERVSGAAGVRQIWAAITQALADVRREMTMKYQVEF